MKTSPYYRRSAFGLKSHKEQVVFRVIQAGLEVAGAGDAGFGAQVGDGEWGLGSSVRLKVFGLRESVG